MPYNVTVDDLSPLIKYQGEWLDSYNLTSDQFTSRYLGNSFHSSRTTESQASFQFNGTAVYIFGAKRTNHGRYSVQVDDEQPQQFDGFAPIQFDGTDGIYQVALYARDNLKNALHNVTLTNDGETNSANPFVDIDYVVWTSNDNADRNQTLDDGKFDYNPSDAWQVSSLYLSQYFGRTEHFTQQGGANATLEFEGTGIYLYGGTLPDHGAYLITIDNRPSKLLSGYTKDFHSRNLLYYADGLGPGIHTLNVTNSDSQGKYLDIDYVEVVQASVKLEQKSRQIAATPIAIGIVCSVLVLLIIATLAVWSIKRRNRYRDELAQMECKPYIITSISSLGSESESGKWYSGSSWWEAKARRNGSGTSSSTLSFDTLPTHINNRQAVDSPARMPVQHDTRNEPQSAPRVNFALGQHDIGAAGNISPRTSPPDYYQVCEQTATATQIKSNRSSVEGYEIFCTFAENVVADPVSIPGIPTGYKISI